MMTTAAFAEEPVLIVGAGPTGLTLANALAAYGVPFTIIDRKEGPSIQSKGLSINIASQYGLELIGLPGAIGKAGCRVRRLSVQWQGRRLTTIDFGRLNFPLRSLITQPQSDTERELVEALEARGKHVGWSSTALDVRQDGEAAFATIEYPDGMRTEQRFSYVIGCEGKHSLVRERMGAQLSGHDHPVYFVLGDFALRRSLPDDQVFYYVWEDTFLIIVPIGAGRWRIVVKYDGVPTVEEISPREISNIVARHLGDDLLDGEPQWMSRAQFYTRISDRLRCGRLFLAGDSAHLVSPIGGTGMNTGMQDALNLAWKLAYRLRGHGQDKLLATYESERIEAIQANAAATDQSTRLITLQNKDAEALGPFMPTMHNRSALRAELPRKHSGLTLSYAHTSATSGADPAPGSTRAGEYCLTLPRLIALLEARGAPTPSAPLIGVVRLDGMIDDEVRHQLQALARLQQAHSPYLQWLVFVPDAGMEELSGTAAPPLISVPPDLGLLQDTAIGPGGLLLIRPDGIVGYSGTLAHMDALRAKLANHFVAAEWSTLPPITAQTLSTHERIPEETP